ncbi:XdhC family protein [Alkanindiges illinoisensis]|uniref:XdhC family protein n=1 Tax=Alkanindiges illinoisensis TaxID=197183 RepID=UPI0005539C29|nr:XdhC/CoxI family protein [Alkanindiges illinoisensis]
MSQLTALLHAIDQAQRQQDDAVMATVVQVEGSAYRRPGARMLIWSHGQPVGTISGGCLENEACKKAQWLTRNAQPALQRYHTGHADFYTDPDAYAKTQGVHDHHGNDIEADDDEALAFGLGCNGTVSVLFERLNSPAMLAVSQLLRHVQASHRAGVIATVISTQPSTGKETSLQLGDRLLLDPVQHELRWIIQTNSPVDSNLHQTLHNDVIFTLTRQKSLHQTYQTAQGSIQVFLEYVAPPNRLVIFGAGHDAQPLVSMAKMQGWHVSVIDSRPHFARRERFMDADHVRCIDLKAVDLKDTAALAELTNLTNGAAVAIMSHSLAQDRQWLKQMLLNPPRYIGQLGPRYRTERLIAEIQQSLSDPTQIDQGLEALHYPIGLDIGGDTPEAIALAIMAEITATLNQRSGKMLKQRDLSIHAE